MTVIVLLFSGMLGLCVGSFLNVVVYRLPRGQSLSYPPSRCPGCGTQLKWRDNIPVLSWLLLGGHCRSCRARISLRYPLIEIATGLVFLLITAAEI